MFGVPIDGLANVFCDNNGVVKNTTIPESMLAKKQHAINYHVVREAVAEKVIRVGKEDGMTNLVDLFTKVLTADQRQTLIMMTCHGLSAVVWARSFTPWSGQGLRAQIPCCGE
jgi:hypothetical protein